MSNKKSFTKEDKVRIQRTETLKTGGTVSPDTFAAKVQHIVDTQPKSTNKQS